ncbi:hypothetical protein M3Y98_00148500 [Aphelenchoides besseyi]|nr:hypothetical protein M3Y98_00148500 [Aphelenchoides besseyi]
MSNPLAVWCEFFKACDLPLRLQKQYAESFVTQRIQPYMLKELGKDELRELGIETLGDQIAILRYIKKADGSNAPAFQQPASTNRESVSTSTIKKAESEPEPRRVLKAKATSSSMNPMQSRSVVIQKTRNQSPIRRVSGLRSDEIIEERMRRNGGVREERFSPIFSSYSRRSESDILPRNVARINSTRGTMPPTQRLVSRDIHRRITFTDRRPREDFERRGDVVKWTVETQKRKSLVANDVHLVLFNSHSPFLATKLLDSKFPSICMIEANQEYANRLKEVFVSESRVHAYHASVQDDIFAVFKKKQVDMRLLNRFLLPPHGASAKETFMIGCIPFPTQQIQILDSLLSQAIIHSRRVANRNVLCRLICSNNQELEFFARPHEHFSFIFNQLFDVLPLSTKDGFNFTHFEPPVPEFPINLYQQKIQMLGYNHSHYYPLVISPKSFDLVVDKFASQSPNLDNTLVVIELGCWMHFTSKFTGLSVVNKQISNLFPEYANEPVFGPHVKSNELTAYDFFEVFPKIRPFFRTTTGRSQLERYIGTLVKVDTTDYAD